MLQRNALTSVRGPKDRVLLIQAYVLHMSGMPCGRVIDTAVGLVVI